MTENLTPGQQKEVKAEVKKQVRQQVKEHLLQKTSFFGSRFKEQTSTALIAAFGLLIALSWKDVVTKFLEVVLKSGLISEHPYLGLLYTALIVTTISIIAIALISRWAKSPENIPKQP